eukprot:983585-Rhodomonas_salina.1
MSGTDIAYGWSQPEAQLLHAMKRQYQARSTRVSVRIVFRPRLIVPAYARVSTAVAITYA